jgi:mono/diheme cytochrome c family protein
LRCTEKRWPEETGATGVDLRSWRIILVALALAHADRSAVVAQGNAEVAKVKNPVAASAESLAAGQQTYRRYCAPCHGLNGGGGPGNDLIPAAPDLTDDVWDHGSTDGEVFDSIKNGVAPDFNMVPWSDKLKDDEIWNTVNYLRSIAKKR